MLLIPVCAGALRLFKQDERSGLHPPQMATGINGKDRCVEQHCARGVSNHDAAGLVGQASINAMAASYLPRVETAEGIGRPSQNFWPDVNALLWHQSAGGQHRTHPPRRGAAGEVARAQAPMRSSPRHAENVADDDTKQPHNAVFFSSLLLRRRRRCWLLGELLRPPLRRISLQSGRWKPEMSLILGRMPAKRLRQRPRDVRRTYISSRPGRGEHAR